MPDLQTLVLFSMAALVLTMSPGPDMLLIASRTVAQGRAAGFATWAGIAAGTYCHGIAAALGLSQLFLAVPAAYDIVRYLGAAYLLYLAWSTFVSAKSEHNQSADKNTDIDTLVTQESINPGSKIKRKQSILRMFNQGLLTNLLNPKMILFVLALVPQFVVVEAGSVAVQILVFVTIINVLGLLVNGSVIYMAAGVTGWLGKGSKVQRWSGYFLSSVFAALALRLMFDDRT